MIGDALKYAGKVVRGYSHEGMYRVLNYESILKILDIEGKHARFEKNKKVKYLQDNIIAYQDHAWGDGKIFQNYQCSPGKAVDKYRSGYKTNILISLREIKNRGDIDNFHIQWDMKNSFLKEEESWSTLITQQTKKITIEVTFPKGRKPYHVILEESNRRRSQYLSTDSFHHYSDGRIKVSYEIQHPRLFEHYILRWKW